MVILIAGETHTGKTLLAQKLLDGLTPAAILEEMDDEEERSRTAKLLSSESGAGEQELRMVADYLRVPGVNGCGQSLTLVDRTHSEAPPGVLLANPVLRGLAQTFQRGHAPTVQHDGFPADGAGLCFPLVDVLHLKGVQVDTLFNLHIS